MPAMTPSLRKPIFTWWLCSRSWPLAWKSSRRLSTHFTGLPQAKRREGDQRLFRVRRALGAEAAADIGSEHANLFGGHADDARDGVADRVRVLRGRPEDEPAGVRVAIGQRAARLDEHRGEARVAEVLAHDHVRGG
jgi:hypothetical protein